MKNKRGIALIAGALAMSMTAAACGSSTKSGSAATTVAGGTATTVAGGTATTTATATTAAPTATTTAPKPAADLKATLNASGSTFAKALYDETIAAFTAKNKGVTINYGGGGSGKGRQDLADQLTDWAGSDSPIADADKAKFKGGDVLYFPIAVAPITLSYNLDGVDKLQLSPETVAKIFLAQIKTWDAPEIAADNPGVKLPSTPVVAAVRSDSSGTTDNFTKFVDRSAGATGVWTLKSGSKVEWPTGVQAAEGNGGVAKLVKDNKGGIGYVDLSDAKAAGLKFASIKNAAGKYIAPDLAGSSAAVDGVTVNADLTFSAPWAKGDASYPVTAQTWLLVYKKQTDKAKGEATKAFVSYLLTDGQATLKDINYGALPKSLVDKAIAQLAMIEIPA